MLCNNNSNNNKSLLYDIKGCMYHWILVTEVPTSINAGIGNYIQNSYYTFI